MKHSLYILLLACASCTSQTATDETTEADTVAGTDNSKYYTKLDTIIVLADPYDTLKYAKDDFNNIVDNHSEFFTDVPQNPDLAYYSTIGPEFGSEGGQDSYYALYAYFLKQRNGIDKYAEQRQKLFDIYTHINSLFQKFQHGGTYFAHQYTRIHGYAEYSIYLMPKKKENIEKIYDIKSQKDLYIKSLRQLIKDENEIDGESTIEAKKERTKDLNISVNELDRLITDKFYLNQAQKFQYGHYQYY